MKILLADDHALIRAGLRGELQELGETIDYVEAWDAASLRSVLEQHADLDLALVDLTMPGMQGSASIVALRQEFPTVPLIVLSGIEDVQEVRAVLRAGASGFIPKASLSKVMLQAIRLVLAGGLYLPPQLMPGADNADAPVFSSVRAFAPPPEAAPGRVELLSPRQRDVFELLAKGLPNKLIARQLGITEGTVKSHIATIFDLLKVHNRVAAVAEARRLSERPVA